MTNDPGPSPTVVIGTAGHIDHGKTALLRALTGIDADRLPEERSRGMTIDVGYAHLLYEDGVEVDFVDVPGHDRLIGNMLVGAGEIDAAMLVVAADDGPRPQTIEHLQLLDALEVRDGLAVVTKVDLVEPARVVEVAAALRALLAGTVLAGAPVLAVSAIGGTGIGELRAAVRGLRDGLVQRLDSPANARGPRRLAVDRVFSPKGRGVVVTGSLRGGPVDVGSSLTREPGGELVRVRELQVHGAPRDRHAGGRTALNLAGDGARLLRRGDVLSDGPGVRGTDRVLVRLRRPAALAAAGSSTPWPPRSRSGLRLHVGTDQVDARVRMLRGTAADAVLVLGTAVATFQGDRAVLREPAEGRLVAAVRVLDLAPPRGAARRRATPERIDVLARAIDDAADEDGRMAALVDLHGALPGAAGGSSRSTASSFAFADDVRTAVEEAALDAVADHHAGAPLSPGLPLPRVRAAALRRLRSLASIGRSDAERAKAAVDALLDRLVAEARLTRLGEALRDPALGSEPAAALVAAMDRLEAALDVAAPPPLAEAAEAAGCPPEGVRALQAGGRIVRLGPELAWSTSAYHRLAAVALDRARTAPLTPAELRDATGTSRKYVLAILEDLDRRGILERTPEGHVPGPRAPRPEPVA